MSLEWMRAVVAGGRLSQYFFSDIWALSLLLLRMGTKWMHIYHFRFSPTRPPVHWSGIRTAFAHGPVCPQSLPPEAVEPEATALKKVRLNWNWRNHIPVFFLHGMGCQFLLVRPQHWIGNHLLSSTRSPGHDWNSCGERRRRCQWSDNRKIVCTSTFSCQLNKVGVKENSDYFR